MSEQPMDTKARLAELEAENARLKAEVEMKPAPPIEPDGSGAPPLSS